MNARLPWWAPAGVELGAAVLRELGATWRWDVRGVDERDQAIARDGPCIFVIWHARMLPIVISHQRRGIVVLVSRHRDGEWIARIAGRFGFGAARGSSTRGGEEGMRELMAALAAGRCAGVTVDGPRGPARHVKPGAVWLASRTGCPLVPVTSASSRTHVFRSWDRFRLPQPFARVGVTSGEPLQVPRDLDDQGLEDWRRKLERALDDLTLATATRVGGREVVESAPASSSMSPR